MNRILAALSIFLFANVTSASESAEFLCKAWIGFKSNGEPFILKKENTALKFKDAEGKPVRAYYEGKYTDDYFIYLSGIDIRGHKRVYYFHDFSGSDLVDHDAILIEGGMGGFENRRTRCYRN
jgi:hypothetical protein